jgi:PAS domain S-box-containing protein
VLYAVVSCGWIATSDLIVLGASRSPREQAMLSMVKGCGFVVTTAVLLFLGLRWAFARERAAHARVNASEALLRAITDALPDAVVLKDREGRWRFANPAALRTLGRRLDEVLGATDLEVLGDPEVARAVREHDERVMRSGEGQVSEQSLRTAAGERVFLASKEPYRDADGRVVGVVGTAVDITERIQAADERRRTEAKLAQAGRLAHLGAWWTALGPAAREDEATVWSDELYRILGHRPGAVRACRAVLLDHVHPEDRDRVSALLEAAVAQRRAFQAEHRIVRPDGEERVVIVRGELVPEEPGHPARMVGALQDVTEQKRLEQGLAEADRRKSEFLGVLSHELRNPLTPIRNALYLLERGAPGTEPFLRARETLTRQVLQLGRLVDDLLDVTRISRGKIQLRPARIDLVEVARRTLDDYRSVFEGRRIACALEAPALPVLVDGDATRLAQVVGNLLTNAAKFTDAGGHVRVAVGREAGGRAVLRVLDDGEGIAPEMIGRLFESFTQADQTLHRSRGGLGLGLALVKGLVELHGGRVSARSAGPGSGAELRIELPLAPEQPVLRDGPRPSQGAMAPRRVLVIEDNVDAAETLREMLLLWDHVVEVAHDGQEGLAKARAFRPDLVLCDIGLPEMNGFEVARAIRADAALASTYLVAVTGYASAEDRRKAADAGFDRHLGKPVPVEVVEDVVASAPGRRSVVARA